jgi:hypothetical protein
MFPLLKAIRKINNDSGSDICDFFAIDLAAKRLEDIAYDLNYIMDKMSPECLEEVCKITGNEVVTDVTELGTGGGEEEGSYARRPAPAKSARTGVTTGNTVTTRTVHLDGLEHNLLWFPFVTTPQS